MEPVCTKWLTALRSLGAKDFSDLHVLENEGWHEVCLTVLAKRILKDAVLSSKPVSTKRK